MAVDVGPPLALPAPHQRGGVARGRQLGPGAGALPGGRPRRGSGPQRQFRGHQRAHEGPVA
eukprot:4192023-Lingulodinium_polyedra.AAC.1